MWFVRDVTSSAKNPGPMWVMVFVHRIAAGRPVAPDGPVKRQYSPGCHTFAQSAAPSQR